MDFMPYEGGAPREGGRDSKRLILALAVGGGHRHRGLAARRFSSRRPWSSERVIQHQKAFRDSGGCGFGQRIRRVSGTVAAR